MVSSAGSCIACSAGSPAPLAVYVVGDAVDEALFAGRTVVRCPSCGLQQISPVPDADTLGTYYRVAYRGTVRRPGSDMARYPYDSAWYLSRGRAVRSFVLDAGWRPPPDRPPAILDVGAGFGHVLFAFSEKLPHALLHATEADPRCAPYLERIGARILPATPDGIPTAGDASFDLILLTHVLEHLVAPVRLLTALARQLRPGGRILIEVPNCPMRFVGQWEFAPHLAFFEKGSLGDAIGRAGGRIETVVTCGPLYEMRTWRDFVPASVRRTIRSRLPRREGGAPMDWSDPDVLPDVRFTASGPYRKWLRALAVFPGRPI